jgi:hypothetical protein
MENEIEQTSSARCLHRSPRSAAASTRVLGLNKCFLLIRTNGWSACNLYQAAECLTLAGIHESPAK